MIGGNLGAAVQMLKVMNQQGGASQSWESYWASHYPSDLLVNVDSDVQITAKWTNNGDVSYNISIETSQDGVIYTEHGTVLSGVSTYVITGLRQAQEYYVRLRPFKGSDYGNYTSAVADVTFATVLFSQTLGVNDTVAWYAARFTDKITQSGGLISAIADKLGGSVSLLQAGTDEKKPVLSDGEITHDGVAQRISSGNITYAQPEDVWIVVKQISWKSRRYILDGKGVGERMRISQYGTTPKIAMAASTPTPVLANCYIGSYQIVEALFNGAASNIRRNYNIENNIGNSGTEAGNKINIGCQYNYAGFGNIAWKEAIFRNKVPSADERAYIYAYLNQKHKVSNHLNRGKLVITFDGTHESFYSLGLPLFKAKGVKATLYLTAQWIGATDQITRSQLIAMYEEGGYDIQAHTMNLEQYIDMTDEEVIADMDAFAQYIEDCGLPPTPHFAYVGGLYNDRVIDLIDDYYVTSRKVGLLADATYIYKNTDKMTLDCVGIQAEDDAFITSFKAIMDTAKANLGAIMTYSHGISVAGGGTTIKYSHLEEIIDYAQSIDMDVITISELYNLMDT